ncbi:MAG: hypothetical protein UX99_C0025G0002 [Candidatus Amesbacteria bacterium GW2011_GWB1_47_26]|uniref:Uncharacterized protein n=1 Tax=Candidatus Amesbacteria bacterium GW2011_GWC2_45_19 TaxID=1618366 RepID=A0A0G1M447_9BACT|nr:MAG: hypothetical protein UW19_C0018G0002 [Candidatus Moranbacteria bacterium GW2011_GWF2_44_10]KKU02867.1 MAG: hypothetical protein UX05_C0006G0040 [Candidatus Amesbacteria bacterium GW2011_GWC2_45_19]KKU68246.1 MAG: hypothetical protein UX93_C0009G0020 [Microgenomates group bacterium GW2011_GWC1_47_20]KKU73960.1 MAG: hypothetical protein UX99_C0025G0002 [Candidatus Amesbacteria bacterium GW2011_GWB1_47_26]
MRKFLISIGHPLYILLKFFISPPLTLNKVRRKKLFKFFELRGGVRGGDTRKKTRKKEVVIYHAKTPYLKNFLKAIYPLTQVRLPVLKIPTLKIHWKLLALVFIGSIGIYFYVFKDLPAPSSLTTQPVPLTTHIRDRYGVELYKIYASQNRTLVKLSDLPLTLRQATIAIEDAEFYQHSGFSLRGIFRALISNSSLLSTRNSSSIQGGSTITQQLVKTALLSPERTLQRKIRELVLAVLVELRYPKDQILEMYLNRVSFGGAAYGIEEAAQTYFGKPASDLTLPESALLAGLPASPTTYSPFGAHPDLAKARQKEVLRRMVSEGFITWNQADAASAADLQFAPQTIDIQAPHFVMYVRDYLARKYGTAIVEQGGLEVITSLDLSIQQIAQTAVTQEVAKVAYLRIGNGAAVVTNPQTGEILAMVGSKNYFDIANDGNFNVTTALRQPGSSIKPLNYALALTRGFTPASTIDDSPIVYKTPGQPPYSPVNYDGRFHGKVTLRTALGSSYNVPAVKILAANGVSNFIEFARKLGISSWTDPSRYGLSLTLGGGEVTMQDMATAFGVFANSGSRVDLYPILSVRDSSGRLLEQSSPSSQSVLDPRVAYLISNILSDNAARTPAFGPNSDLNVPNVAVKTGTTNNLRDNWTIGYTPDRLVAVWVGNNDNSPMSYVASGVTGASPIWRRIMTEILKTTPSAGFASPANLVKVNICTITGQLACEGCPGRSEYFIPGTEPRLACTKEAIEKLLEDKAKKDQKERDKLLQGIHEP